MLPHTGRVKRNSAFEYAQSVRIHIICEGLVRAFALHLYIRRSLIWAIAARASPKGTFF